VAGFVYGGGTLAFGLLLRSLPEGVGGGPLGLRWEGAFVVMFPLIVTWVGDSGAYFMGRRFGRRKLIPAVSPGKSVEGAWGGLAAAGVAAVLLHVLVLRTIPGLGLSLPVTAAIGLLLGVAAQVGDLAESVLKREAGVKDSGALLPGHGGILDRFDAVLFNLPLCWLLFELGRRLS
jgi:phosphatidate cytidylyltransferase